MMKAYSEMTNITRAAVLLAAALVAGSARAQEPKVVSAAAAAATAANQTDDTYVLTLRPEAAAVDGKAAAEQLAATYGGELVESAEGEGGAAGYRVRIGGGRARLLASDGRVASLTTGSGVAAAATWNPGLAYQYDGSGNVTAVGNDAYTYDPFNRLATSKVNGATRSYTYDEYGNRKSCTENNVACEGAAPADPNTNRMSGLSYDADGNVIGDGSHTYDYDALNMQIRDTIGTSTREYVYTADDERIAVYSKTTSTNSGWWKWSVRGLDNKVLREFTSIDGANGALGAASWTWTKDYIWRDGFLLATRQPIPGSSSISTYSYHLDHLGTPRLITDANGYAVGIHDYHPFGAEAAGGANEPSLSVMKFTGHERDLVDGPLDALDYMHARYYSAHWGRFLSPDPAFGSRRAPQSWNRYQYVLNSPLNYVDPTGEKEIGFKCNADGSCESINVPDPELSGQYISFGTPRDLLHWYASLRSPLTGLTAGETWKINGQAVAAFGDGFNPLGDPLRNMYGSDASVEGIEYSYWIGFTTFQAEALIAATYGGAAVGETATVSRWGREGLQSGDWVMLGGRNIRNYLFSGKAQSFGSNQAARYATGTSYQVASRALRLPNEGSTLLNLVKAFIGQRIYRP